MKQGQPVTFTDFFGLLIGQTLLGTKVSCFVNTDNALVQGLKVILSSIPALFYLP